MLTPRDDLPEPPRMPNLGEAFTRPYQHGECDRGRPGLRAHRLLLRTGHRGRNPRRLPSPIPPCDLDGLRRRTRAMIGRCQGFFCGAEVDAMMTEAGL